MTLWNLFLDNQGRVIHKWTHFFPVYERYLERFVGRTVTLFEIGCGEGGSLRMWKSYLGPAARIVGIDTTAAARAFEEEQVSVRIGDQRDETFLRSLLDEFGPPDVVIDDGSHIMSHIASTFRVLYPALSRNGVYMVEDTHTCYWEQFEGGLRRPGTFIELAKNMVDDLHAHWTRGQLAPGFINQHTLSIAFHDSLVVLERGTLPPRTAPQIGRAA